MFHNGQSHLLPVSIAQDRENVNLPSDHAVESDTVILAKLVLI